MGKTTEQLQAVKRLLKESSADIAEVGFNRKKLQDLESILENQKKKEMKKEVAEVLLKTLGYKNLEFLGQGTFNTVFKCNNPKGELVAAKVVFGKENVKGETIAAKEMQQLMPSGLKQYLNKFLSWSGINKSGAKKDKHYFKYTNIPLKKNKFKDIFKFKEDTGFEDAAIFEAPLVDGDTFEKFLKDENIQNIINELRKMAKNSLKALDLMHSKGMVHLDIKPQNILQSSLNGKVKYMLADFGTVNLGMQNLNKKQIKIVGITGTPIYRPPEYIKNAIIEKNQVSKLDIYSLGAALYTIYVKRILQQTYTGRQTITALHSSNPRQTESTDESLFFEFVRKLTNDDPKQRPTAKQALKHLFLKKS